MDRFVCKKSAKECRPALRRFPMAASFRWQLLQVFGRLRRGEQLAGGLQQRRRYLQGLLGRECPLQLAALAGLKLRWMVQIFERQKDDAVSFGRGNRPAGDRLNHDITLRLVPKRRWHPLAFRFIVGSRIPAYPDRLSFLLVTWPAE